MVVNLEDLNQEAVSQEDLKVLQEVRKLQEVLQEVDQEEEPQGVPAAGEGQDNHQPWRAKLERIREEKVGINLRNAAPGQNR